MPSTVSNLVLIDTLRRTKLITPEQLTRVKSRIRNQFVNARTLARTMLREGWLTVYQINQLLAGQGKELVLGSYQILDQLGQGGQSIVYKARHSKTGQVVALKAVREEILSNPESAAQFVREMEAMTALDHPNVVQLFEADRVGDLYYCALEYVQGTDLGKYVRLAGPLPAAEASNYICQTTYGLQHAHEQNLVHRDIKPANLYLTDARPRQSRFQEKTIVKILDWGLASLCPNSVRRDGTLDSKTKILIGTADYLSPEQAMDPDSVDIRGDIYSLGCTFYYMLAGHPPFPKGPVMKKILAHQREEPTPIEVIRPDVPPALAAIVKRMMAKNPDDRFRTPDAVGMAIKPHCRASRMSLPLVDFSPRDNNLHQLDHHISDSSANSTFGAHDKGDTLNTTP